MMHQDPVAFPDPLAFKPERWLNAEHASRMEKSFIPFGKGTRQCVGMPYVEARLINPILLMKNRLAYCELYVTLGTLFRRFENLKCDKLSAYDRSYIDHFSSFVPADAAVFKVFVE
jgi:cytochrome P450